MLLAGALAGLGRPERAESEAARRAGDVRAPRAARGDRGGGRGAEPREVDVLRLVAEGLSDAQIAERLFLSPHTVHRHVANVRTQARRAVARGRGRARDAATACSS